MFLYRLLPPALSGLLPEGALCLRPLRFARERREFRHGTALGCFIANGVLAAHSCSFTPWLFPARCGVTKRRFSVITVFAASAMTVGVMAARTLPRMATI